MSGNKSQKQILKSTGILGSAQVIIVLIGIVRVKVLAVLLGATGVGIAGLYQTTIDLIKSLTGFGLGYSAVRDIAASAATNDEKKIATTILVLRRWVWGTGLLGMLIAIMFCRQLSQLAFGSTSYASGIAILSIGLLLTSISAGQLALLQGLRRIGDMAKANVFSSLMGLLGAVAIYYFWGLKGIVPALLLSYVLGLIVNWYFSRKIKTVPVAVSPAEVFQKGKAMASLGFYLSLTGLAATGTMYLVRSFVVQQGGLASVGHFVAAWTISSMYTSAIFGAMGADFFPRLSSVQQDRSAVIKLVNEQAEIAILITAPIIIGMVSFIDLIVRIFYSKDFGPTAGILDWQLVGDFFKVLAWPIGFIILAKGKGRIFAVTEFAWNLLFCGSVYFGWKLWGIEVTGIAFLLSYLVLLVIVFFVAKWLVGFRWSDKMWQYVLVFLPLLVMCFLSVRYLEQVWRYAICSAFTLIAVVYSFTHLKSIVNLKSILNRLKKQSEK